ncbi:MAG: imidazolonepropionase [Bacteroidota bacterium]
MALLVKNIRTLVHVESQPEPVIRGENMDRIVCLEHAYLLVEDGRIAAFGPEDDHLIDSLQKKDPSLEVMDAGGGHLLPSWCDSHTHIVFAGSREQEFEDRIRGLSYQEIASRGGGILQSARRLRGASESELFESAMKRVDEMVKGGTGAIEIKSGYGLDEESELKMLRVIRRIGASVPFPVRATFLGAHALPEEYRNDKAGYLRLLTDRLLPRIAEEGLADYCDIFCEQGYFDPNDTRQLLKVAKGLGIKGKVHAEQLSHSGGILAGVDAGAESVDHLEYADENDLKKLAGSTTIPVLLPGAQLFLGLKPPPAREMIDAGLPVALASDFNPGSSPSGNMNQMVSLACILYKMTPSEAIVAATTNSAAAMGLSDKVGSIAVGKVANFFITHPIPSVGYLPYYFGQHQIATTVLNGKVVNSLST